MRRVPAYRGTVEEGQLHIRGVTDDRYADLERLAAARADVAGGAEHRSEPPGTDHGDRLGGLGVLRRGAAADNRPVPGDRGAGRAVQRRPVRGAPRGPGGE